jgi:hypothetical protein
MSAEGQERRIGAVRNISALPLRADVGADIVEPPVSVITGREQLQQTNVRQCGYSITSSASESRLSEILMPSAFAVLRLITVSNLVGCRTGRSAGFAPLRIRAV